MKKYTLSIVFPCGTSLPVKVSYIAPGKQSWVVPDKEGGSFTVWSEADAYSAAESEGAGLIKNYA